MDLVLKMSFLIFSNADIQFAKKEWTWKSYITKKALPTTQKIEFINKKKFAKAKLDENIEVFVIPVICLSLGSKMTI